MWHVILKIWFRLAIAMAPSTMTKMIATGMSQARILVWSAVAPVVKGEACARASPGKTRTGKARRVPSARLPSSAGFHG